ncbi:MAG: hypothetical protein NC048_02585 [Bacteroides sp.]|nr:hypothetical protein [Bacteroides sp.]MCM1531474.1 hypothetical protein [Ruminococcus flavefaciens]MCM1554364.1 hypothetical protein [Bacteroides sp.]
MEIMISKEGIMLIIAVGVTGLALGYLCAWLRYKKYLDFLYVLLKDLEEKDKQKLDK